MTTEERNIIVEQMYHEKHHIVDAHAKMLACAEYGRNLYKQLELEEDIKSVVWTNVLEYYNRGYTIKHPTAFLIRACKNHYINHGKSTRGKQLKHSYNLNAKQAECLDTNTLDDLLLYIFK